MARRAAGASWADLIIPRPIDIFTYDFYKRLGTIRRIVKQQSSRGVCAFGSFPVQISVRSGINGSGTAAQAFSNLVSGTFFWCWVEPILGRTIAPADTDAPGRSPVAVISHRYWQQELAADPAVIGRVIKINGTLFTVIGVMPGNFYGVDLNSTSPDMWLPITMQAEVMQQPVMLDSSNLY